MAKENHNERKNAGEVAISLGAEEQKGAYCNLAAIHHSQSEFVFDFIFVQGNQGQVVSRVITNPQHAKALLTALEENIGKYEAQHGRIAPPTQPAQKPVIKH